MIDNHEWEVPNEPGWEEIIQNVNSIHRQLTKCVTAAECRRVAEEIRAIFARYPVSKDYFDTYKDDAEDIFSTIFKWG